MLCGFKHSLGVWNRSYMVKQKLPFLKYTRKKIGWYLLTKKCRLCNILRTILDKRLKHLLHKNEDLSLNLRNLHEHGLRIMHL